MEGPRREDGHRAILHVLRTRGVEPVEVVPSRYQSNRFSAAAFHSAAIVGDFVLDALRGLDIPRGGSSLGRTR